MKNNYRIEQQPMINGEPEARTLIYCEELGELFCEDSGNGICTEQDTLEDVLAGTQYEGQSLHGIANVAAGWAILDEAGYDRLGAGARDWIDAKEA